MKWYWVCEGKTEFAFNVKLCTKTKWKAKIYKAFNKPAEGNILFIKETYEHSDENYKQYTCDVCGYVMSKKELHAGWDWGGPHCPKCGYTGLAMFASVQEQVGKSVKSGRIGWPQ